jgi:hypothetical protein
MFHQLTAVKLKAKCRFRAASILFYIPQKYYLRKVLYLSKIFQHKQFEDLLSGVSIHLYIIITATMLILVVGIEKVQM